MVLAATGVQGEALEKLVWLIANSPTFQKRRNVSNQYAAEKFIYYPYLESAIGDVQDQRPCVIIQEAEFLWSWVSGGDKNHLEASGALTMIITDNDRHAGDFKGSYVDFRNFADGVVFDVVSHAAESDNLAINGLRQSVAPQRSHPTAEPASKGFWEAQFEVSYGFGEGE